MEDKTLSWLEFLLGFIMLNASQANPITYLAVTGTRNSRNEPSLGTGPAGDAEPGPRLGASRMDFAPSGNRPKTHKRKGKKRRRGAGIALNILLFLFAATLGAGGYYAYEKYMAQHVSLDEFDLQGGGTQVQVEYARPTGEKTGPLSEAQLRWCLRQEIIVDALDQVVQTNREIFKLETMRGETQAICVLDGVDPALLEAAKTHVLAKRDAIIEETLDAQLLYLSADDAEASKSQIVSEIQTLLDSMGYNVGYIDGIYGSQTKVAIKAFERDHGLPENGKATEQLLATLRQAAVKSGG